MSSTGFLMLEMLTYEEQALMHQIFLFTRLLGEQAGEVLMIGSYTEPVVLVNMKTGGGVVSQPTSLLMEQVVFWLEC